jgi:hypothetical protein
MINILPYDLTEMRRRSVMLVTQGEAEKPGGFKNELTQ